MNQKTMWWIGQIVSEWWIGHVMNTDLSIEFCPVIDSFTENHAVNSLEITRTKPLSISMTHVFNDIQRKFVFDCVQTRSLGR